MHTVQWEKLVLVDRDDYRYNSISIVGLIEWSLFLADITPTSSFSCMKLFEPEKSHFLEHILRLPFAL